MRLGRGLCAVFLAGVFALATGAPVETAEPRSDAALSFTEQTLYSFCSQSGCTDGRNPYAGLIVDGSGNLYGTTVQGGARNSGTVFQLTPTGTGWSEQVLYSFCSQTDCTDGATPYGGLIMDESGDDGAGNLYATTSSGGVVLSCCGTVFQLTPTGTGWNEQVLYRFCSQSNCTDGRFPYGGLIMDGSGDDGAGNLYGTTYTGGAKNWGTVFQLTPTGTEWSEQVLYSFCSQSNCTDGRIPQAGLIMDGSAISMARPWPAVAETRARCSS